MGVYIKGTGRYLPERVVTNEDFTKIVETSDEWITTRTGIKQRHLSNGEPTWYMGLQAAKQAMASASITAEEIDLILHTSVTPDYQFPSMACVLQGKLGAVHATGIDINCACAAFVYAVDMAEKYLASGAYRNILIVSAENLTKTVDYTDRSTCVLFGDGAGAAVLSASDGMYASCLGAEGENANKIVAELAPPQNAFMEPSLCPAYEKLVELPAGKEHFMHMDGGEVYKFSTRVIASSIEAACARAGITPADLDWVVSHQANERIIQTGASRLKLPLEKFYMNISRYGNTSSASIPIGLDEMAEQGLLKRGQKIALVGFGAGLVYGAAVLTY